MTQKYNTTTQLLSAQLNAEMVYIISALIAKDSHKFVENQTEIKQIVETFKPDVNNVDADIKFKFDSELDSFNRTTFTLELTSCGNKMTAKTQMKFNQDNLYEEGEFNINDDKWLTISLLNNLRSHHNEIIDLIKL